MSYKLSLGRLQFAGEAKLTKTQRPRAIIILLKCSK